MCRSRGCLGRCRGRSPSRTSGASSRRRTREHPPASGIGAILELLYGSGLRISELTGLDVDDLDLEEGSVRVLGKGGKEREVPLGSFGRDAVGAYLTRGRPALATAGHPRAPCS